MFRATSIIEVCDPDWSQAFVEVNSVFYGKLCGKSFSDLAGAILTNSRLEVNYYLAMPVSLTYIAFP